ncbi:hypothetical protein [Glutamicibacter arilaitensis]|uniref:hypothetical protein n=1 Tax=Glutamicibacter arilaitensis TaxID=256701 RepID=UPI00384AE514
MTQPSEKLDDVMGLVSVHKGPVLVAMTETSTDALRLLHVSEPSPALELVAESGPDSRIDDLFRRAEQRGMSTFRVRYWKHSAVAHVIPAFVAPAPIQPLAVPSRFTGSR